MRIFNFKFLYSNTGMKIGRKRRMNLNFAFSKQKCNITYTSSRRYVQVYTDQPYLFKDQISRTSKFKFIKGTWSNFNKWPGGVLAHTVCPLCCGSWTFEQKRQYSTSVRNDRLVLGIETSCDDTGVAVVSEGGALLGEAINSQTKIHVELGGIIPPVARDLHKQNIEQVVSQALERAKCTLQDVDAIAVTVKPGLSLSLAVGLHYAKQLHRQSGKPLIPIHHMEAHALTARMIEQVDFPFLVLLISGGHCLLAVVRSVDDFLLIGQSTDEAPGDSIDKIARELKLKNLPECAGMSGGQAIETMARQGDPKAFGFPTVMKQIPDCNFSFAGLKSHFKRIISREEKEGGIEGSMVLPNAADICASFQYAVLRHLAKRVQRAFLFCEMKGLLPKTKSNLVVSGGVASNMFIRSGLETVCGHYESQLVCPPPKLCTDNGIMIAWNGVERLRAGIGIAPDPESLDIMPKCQLGTDISHEVGEAAIKVKRIKLLP